MTTLQDVAHMLCSIESAIERRDSERVRDLVGKLPRRMEGTYPSWLAKQWRNENLMLQYQARSFSHDDADNIVDDVELAWKILHLLEASAGAGSMVWGAAVRQENIDHELALSRLNDDRELDRASRRASRTYSLADLSSELRASGIVI